jgi:hypothetical protein
LCEFVLISPPASVVLVGCYDNPQFVHVESVPAHGKMSQRKRPQAPKTLKKRFVIIFIARCGICDKTINVWNPLTGHSVCLAAWVLNGDPNDKPMKSFSSKTSNLLRALPMAGALALCFSASASYQSTVLGDAPVAYYRLEELTGTTTFDATTNHFDQTYATDLDTNGVTTWPELGLPGISTNSILFRHYTDASSIFHHGFVNLTYRPELSPVAADGKHGAPFSVECWVQPLTQPADYSVPLAMFGRYESGDFSNASGWNFYQTPGPNSVWVFNVKNGPFATASAVPIQPLKWYHLAATFDGSTFIFYVNGVAQVTASGQTGYLADHLFDGQIGAGDNTGFLPFNGGVDEVAFYTNVLSSAQVTNHYSVGLGSFSPRSFPPIILEDPVSTTAVAGSAASFTVMADGATPLTYKWLRSGAVIAGATNNPYTFTASYPADDGATFRVVLSNSFGMVTSAVATLTVVGTLSIDHDPFSITRTAGSNSVAAFRVAAGGSIPIRYQWFKITGAVTNIIAGATNDTLWVSGLQVSDSGNQYFAHVTNNFVVTNSGAATLTVNPRTATVALGGYANIIVADHPVAYWRLSETNGSTTAVDAVGSFDGTYAFSGSDLTFGYPPGIPHETNSAIHLTNSATVTVPYALELNPVSGPWSAEFWLQPTSLDSGNFHTPISSEGSVPGHIYGWNMYQHVAGVWTFASFNGGTGPGFFSDFADNPLIPNKWYHIVVTDDLSTLRMYVNNALVTSFARAGNFVPNGINGDPSVLGGPTTFGVRSDGGFGGWDGGMDEVAFYNYTLSTAQVRNHFVNSVPLGISRVGNNIVVTWPVGTLQAASTVTGTYTNVPSATSPYTNGVGNAPKYFRLQLQ